MEQTEIRVEGYVIEECKTESSFGLIVFGHPIFIVGNTKEWVYERASDLLKKYSNNELGFSSHKKEFCTAFEHEDVLLPQEIVDRISEFTGVVL